MKSWQLTKPKTVEHVTIPAQKVEEGLAKIKITKALLSETDAAVFSGATKVKPNLTLGKFAIGQVTEADENSFLQKGDRVYLSPTVAGAEPLFAGETADGYYKDFVFAGADVAYPLPPSVSDEAAMLVDAVAMAEHFVDEAQITVGQHVLVVGGGLYGNVLCQILIYHRAVPILADNNPERLERARKCGIYYTFPHDETLRGNLLQATGGRLADAAAYLAFANKTDLSSVFSLVVRGAHVTVCAHSPKTLPVNLENALRHQIKIDGVIESEEYISTAINDLANKAVKFSEFPIAVYPEEKIPEILQKAADSLSATGTIGDDLTVFKFVL